MLEEYGCERECTALDSRHNCVAGFSRVWIWHHVKVMLSKVCVGGVDYYIGSVFIGALWWNSRGWWASPWWRIMHGQRTHTDARTGADVAMPGPTTDYRTTSSKNMAQVTLTRLIFRRSRLGASLFPIIFFWGRSALKIKKGTSVVKPYCLPAHPPACPWQLDNR